MEAEDGASAVPCAQAMPVELSSAGDMISRRQRLQRAMQMLNLKPYLHPSQDTKVTISASPDDSLDRSEGNDGDVTTVQEDDGQLKLS